MWARCRAEPPQRRCTVASDQARKWARRRDGAKARGPRTEARDRAPPFPHPPTRPLHAPPAIPVTNPARTLDDLHRVLPAEQFAAALREAEFLRLPIGDRFTPDRTRSELEARFLSVCRRHRLPRPEVNVRVGPYTVDFLWRKACLGRRGRRLGVPSNSIGIRGRSSARRRASKSLGYEVLAVHASSDRSGSRRGRCRAPHGAWPDRDWRLSGGRGAMNPPQSAPCPGRGRPRMDRVRGDKDQAEAGREGDAEPTTASCS